MIIRCPQCGHGFTTRYQIGVTPREAHCPRCAVTFEVFAALRLESAGTPLEPEALALPALRALAAERVHATPTRGDVLEQQRAASSRPETTQPPAFLHRPPGVTVPRPRRTALFGLGVGLVLLAALGLQIMVLHAQSLAQQPELRAVVHLVCQYLPCITAARLPVSQVRVQVQDAQQDASDPGRMTVQFILQNPVTTLQPWPTLHLELSDRYGHVVGQGSLPAQQAALVLLTDDGRRLQAVPTPLAPDEQRHFRLVVRTLQPPPHGIDGVVLAVR